MGNPRANGGDCGAGDDLLKARWQQIASDPDHANLDFIVDVVFYKWDALARVLPKDSGDSGQRYYTANDINRFNHDWRTYKLRCRAALVEWVQGHNDPDQGPSQLLEALKVAGLGALTGKVLSGIHPSRPKMECLQINSSTRVEAVCETTSNSKEILRCISSSEIRRLPEHPINKSGALGTNTSVAMWQGALVALKELGHTAAAAAAAAAAPGQSRGERLTSLRQDCHALSLLRHPGVLAIYGLHAPTTGALAMVMEAMETTLYASCRLQPRLLFADVLSVLVQVVSALVYVEGMGAALTELSTKTVFLLRTHRDSRHIAKVGGHAVALNATLCGRRLSAPHSLAAAAPPEPAAELFQQQQQQRHMKRSLSAGSHAHDTVHTVGTMALEALHGGALVGNSPQRWVADLARHELDARFTHLLSQCLERVPGGRRITTAHLLDRLEALGPGHEHHNAVVAAAVATATAPSPDAPATIAVPHSFLQRSSGEKKMLYSESSAVDYSPPAVQASSPVYDSDFSASDASSLCSVSSVEATEADHVQARGTRCRIRIEQADEVVIDETPAARPSYQQQIHAKEFVSTSPTSPVVEFHDATPPFHVAECERGSRPELDPTSPDQTYRRSSSKNSVVLPAVSVTPGHRQCSPSGSVVLPATTGVTACPGEVSKDLRSSTEAVNSSVEAASSSEQGGATMWRKFRLRALGVGSFRRKKAAADVPPSSLALVRKDLHETSNTGGSHRFLLSSESSADRAPSTASTPQGEENQNHSFNVPARQTTGVKCLARYSHIGGDHRELTIHCGEPLVVWQGEADSGQSDTFYARSSISGSTGIVSPDNVVPLKRVKRRLHAYSFDLQPQHELERVKRLLEEKLSGETLPQFCDILLKDMYPSGGYEAISKHCRSATGSACEFEEMFRRWRGCAGANGLEYFEAAKVVGDGYQYHVLSILNVLFDP